MDRAVTCPRIGSKRLWSLRDLTNLQLDVWLKTVSDYRKKIYMIMQMDQTVKLAPFTEAEIESYMPDIDVSIQAFRNLGFRCTAVSMENVKSICLKGAYPYEICKEMDDVIERLEDESKESQFLLLDAEECFWFKRDPKEFFTEKVFNKLKGSRYDMSESMRCFALERYTASAGHSMKLTEAAIRSLAIKVLGSAVAIRRNFEFQAWHNLHNEMNRDLKAITSFRNKRHKTKIEKQLLALDRFDTIRRLRNESQHEGTEYSRRESKDILEHVSTFLQQVVDVI